MRNLLKTTTELLKSRLIIFLLGVILLFIILAVRLFSLQIMNGEKYQNDLKTSIMRKLTIPASRGNIYDKYGRPLASNLVAFSVKIDDSIKIDIDSTKNSMLFDVVNYLEEKNSPVSDILPISETKPYTFTIGQEEEKKWKSNLGLKKNQLNMSAQETLDYFSQKFEIADTTPEKIKRKIISLGIEINDKNLMLSYLINILQSNGETIIDDLPISKTEPYTFLFDENKSKEIDWKKSVAMSESKYSFTAPESIDYLVDFFDIPSNFSNEMKRTLIAIRYSLYLERYRKYQPITVALDINDKTVANIEEKQDSFPGVTIDTDSLRNYNGGKYFSHILGYIRKISDTEYEQYKQYGYTISDIIGKSGIEKVKELDLNGTDGEMLVEVDSVGRRINTIETKPPVSGKDVFLTIDKNLQTKAYDYLETALRDVLISKLNGKTKTDTPISLKQLFTSMVSCNTISVKKIYDSKDGEQLLILNLLKEKEPDLDVSKNEDLLTAKQALITAIDKGEVSNKQLILILYEQGKISADSEYLDSIKSGKISPLTVINQKLMSGEIKPSDTNLEPCTGSVVVSDVNSGNVYTLVTYPSYDNNQLVNNFNNEYYSDLLNDPTTPLVNRPLSQKKAPGSTFKMISAIAGLESGTITPQTLITDLGSFTKAGKPYAKCWIYSNGGTHGTINVSTALEVSCNYFFYELGYRMGNYSSGTTLKSISTLNKYMEAFGLNSVTGIEIGESEPNMASPEYKEQIIKWQNPDATSSYTKWTDGDTIRTFIGQSVNNYAPAHINKYIATLANGGTRYKMHLIDKVENPDKTISEKVDEQIENVMDIKPQNLSAVFEGMLKVTSGTRGTLRNIFRDFPIKVAAKSGTAQENLSKNNHTWFVCFAPYENPQIAVTVMIPFGEHSSSPASVVAKNIIAEYMGLNYVPENNNLDNTLAK